MARTVTKQLNLGTIFSATTGAAAARLKALTINSVLSLGLTKDKVLPGSDRTTPNMKAKIERLFQNVQVLIIDEISMCTPVTVARIEKWLRDCLDPSEHFGGLHSEGGLFPRGLYLESILYWYLRIQNLSSYQ